MATATIPSTKRYGVAPIVGFKALGDGTSGEFEAYVSVFGVVDYDGDRIVPGAFADTLKEWTDSGDPLPVIFSHQWGNLDAHVGVVAAAEEHYPGDERLPEEIRDFGGLWIKGRLDVGEDEPFAQRLWKRMKERRIKEFSFGFEVRAERAAADANNIIKVGLFEVGPTFKGANPATVLLDVKAAEPDALADDVSALVDELLTKARKPAAKMFVDVDPDGSMEGRIAAVYAAAKTWAVETYGDELYAVHLEATYAEKAVVVTERWSDPIGIGPIWELAYSIREDGLAIDSATEVEAEVTLTPKSAALRNFKAALEAGRAKESTILGHGTGTLSPESMPEGKGAQSEAEPVDELTAASDAILLAEVASM